MDPMRVLLLLSLLDPPSEVVEEPPLCRICDAPASSEGKLCWVCALWEGIDE